MRGLWRWLSVPVFAGLTWVGAVNTMGVVNEIRYGVASLDWPGTVGTIESSRLEVRHGRSWRRIPHIVYRYEFDGRLLRSGRIGASSQHDKAEALVAAWRPGMRVQVYHDPETGMPALVRGYSRSAWFRLAVLLGVTTVPLMLSLFASRLLLAPRAQSRP
jgi:hypothetical protein